MNTSSQSCIIFDVALMYRSTPSANNTVNHPNPRSFPDSSPPSDDDRPGLSTFVYDSGFDGCDDGDGRSDGVGRLCRVKRDIFGILFFSFKGERVRSECCFGEERLNFQREEL